MSDEEITYERTRMTFQKVSDRVLDILIHLPSTRSSDSTLFLEYLRRYADLIVWNPETQLIEPTNKKGWNYNEYIQVTKVYGTIERSRQKMQNQAYYRIQKALEANQKPNPQDELIQPTPEISQRRRQREYYMRRLMSE